MGEALGGGGQGTKTWFSEEVVQISVNRSKEDSWKSGMGTVMFLESLGDNWTPFCYRSPLGVAIRMGGCTMNPSDLSVFILFKCC